MHGSFQNMFFSEYMPGMKLQGYTVVLFLFFQGNFILFSIVTVPIYSPINSVVEMPTF